MEMLTSIYNNLKNNLIPNEQPICYGLNIVQRTAGSMPLHCLQEGRVNLG